NSLIHLAKIAPRRKICPLRPRLQAQPLSRPPQDVLGWSVGQRSSPQSRKSGADHGQSSGPVAVTMRGQWQVIRGFLSGSVDDLAFQDVSLHRQVSIIYTPNGPLI